MTFDDDHHDCEVRHEELLDRVRALSARIYDLEQGQRMIVDLLRDFRDLVRLVVTRVRTLDRRTAEMATWPRLLHGPYERIARHFRN